MQPHLPLARYQLSFHSADTRPAPRFAGSAWRGALGHALRHIACLTGAPECGGCPRLHQCAHSYLFDTPVPPDAAKLTRYSEAPHPYVLLEHTLSSGQVQLELTLFGHANRHLALMVQALSRAAASGLGIAGRHLDYRHISQWNEATQAWQTLDTSHGTPQALPATTPNTPPVPVHDIQIELLTPLRVRRNGQHVTPNQFEFPDLFGNLLRRISLLSSFHTDTPLDTDFRQLTQHAKTIPIQSTLRWHELNRHSQRQKTDMTLGGVIGTLSIPANDIADFWPYLWLGQYTHAGRATTMGLGCYRIQPASLPNATPTAMPVTLTTTHTA